MTLASILRHGAAICALAVAAALPAAARDFRIAVGDGAGGTQEALGRAFIAALERQTGGAHTAKLFLNGQLGDEQDTVTAAATGTLDFSILAINNITPFSPTVGVLTMPYVIMSQQDAETLVVRSDFEDRERLVEEHPTTFSVTPRIEGHQKVLADTRRGDLGAVRAALTAAWELQRR